MSGMLLISEHPRYGRNSCEPLGLWLQQKFARSKNYPASSSGFRTGATRWGDGARLMGVQAPLTPRPRGTIYEAMPLILGCV